MDDDQIAAFIRRWAKSAGAERANYQLFLTELCDVLEVERPAPTVAVEPDNAYVFEKNVVFNNGDGTHSTRRIDLYRRAAFICETKQGVETKSAEQPLSERQQASRAKSKKGHGERGSKAWDYAMLQARGQAEQYARNLPAAEGRPPFLLVIDVGHTIELYAEFSQTGGVYTAFPDPLSHRIKLGDLADPAIRARLRQVWTEPLALDPAKRSAKVTREIAAKLAELAKSLERDKHDPEDVAQFLMRCLFTMFAEDVGLLETDSFKNLLKRLDDPAGFVPTMEELWRTMNIGGFSVSLNKVVKRFNGGLFAENQAIPLNRDQLDLLIEAAEQSWNDVEPAIFGTLLERALDPVERHKLGAHYTPRAYVERLVIPTVVEPLRAEWDAARAAAVTLAKQGDTAGAVAELERFHDRLCEVKVLDPACGSGNFLYVTLEHLKRLEGEVFTAYESIAHRQMTFEESHTVDPHQLLGIEINPRAAAIAELVLWIGYLQWHYRTRGKVSPPEPIIKDFKNIECRDAVLAWASKEALIDVNGKVVRRWDGHTTKPHPVTGEEVPDEAASVVSYQFTNPEKALWPEAEFVVGNPPFVGNKRMRYALGPGYVEALRDAHGDVPESVDYVMYWWNHAGNLLRTASLRRFGLITTNSITQNFNSRVVASHLKSGNTAIAYAVPDHPWVDSSDGADVRIAMTVVATGNAPGRLEEFIEDGPRSEVRGAVGQIDSQLSLGVSLASANRLKANKGVACPGVQLSGQGFILSEDDVLEVSTHTRERLVKRYVTGRDLAQTRRVQYVLDTFGVTQDRLRSEFADAYQWLHDRVKPDRDQNPRAKYAREWWLHSEPRGRFRKALIGLPRFVATSRTSRHRFFEFLNANYLPETNTHPNLN